MNWKRICACHQWVCDGEMLLLCTGLLTMAAGWKLFRLWLVVWLVVTVLALYTAIQYHRLPQEDRQQFPNYSGRWQLWFHPYVQCAALPAVGVFLCAARAGIPI